MGFVEGEVLRVLWGVICHGFGWGRFVTGFVEGEVAVEEFEILGLPLLLGRRLLFAPREGHMGRDV